MNILVFPKASNPYQDLLYKHLEKTEQVHYHYLSFQRTSSHILNCCLFPIRLWRFRLQNYSVVHIHWLYEFGISGLNTIFSRGMMTGYICFIWIVMKLLGYRIVYTLHDSQTHDDSYLFENWLTHTLIKLSDKVICLSPATLTLLQTYKTVIPPEKLSVIPHGNYIEWYENTLTKPEARKKLLLPTKKFVFLFLGIIRPYKGITELIATWEILLKEEDIYCVIAGACYDDDLRIKIKAFAKHHNRFVLTQLQHIPEIDLQLYFNACDCVVLPYRRITNSGSAILAASFQKPFVAPYIGSLTDFPKNSGIFYEHSDTAGLLKALKRAIHEKNKLPHYGKKAFQYVSTMSWENIAKMTSEVYKNV